MNIAKIAAASGTIVLGTVAAVAGLNKPTFTTLTKVFYTLGTSACPFIQSISTAQFTTNGNPGTGVQATIKTVGGVDRKMWGACALGVGSHPAHFHP